MYSRVLFLTTFGSLSELGDKFGINSNNNLLTVFLDWIDLTAYHTAEMNGTTVPVCVSPVLLLSVSLPVSYPEEWVGFCALRDSGCHLRAERRDNDAD